MSTCAISTPRTLRGRSDRSAVLLFGPYGARRTGQRRRLPPWPRALWEQEALAHQGAHVEFENVDAHPRPAQQPLPEVVGGHTRAPHRRAARDAHGWYGFLLGLRATAEQRELLRTAISEAGRERPLHVSVTPARPLDPGVVARYAELGVDRLIVMPPPGIALEELIEFVERNAPGEVGAATRPGG